MPRVEPYTEDEIGDAPCCRCGDPSVSQWDCCAAGNEPLALCVECDIGLNRAALNYIKYPGRVALMKKYAETKQCPG